MTETVVYEITGQTGSSSPGNTPHGTCYGGEGWEDKEGQRLSPHSAPELIVMMIDYLFRIYHVLGEPQREGWKSP